MPAAGASLRAGPRRAPPSQHRALVILAPPLLPAACYAEEFPPAEGALPPEKLLVVLTVRGRGRLLAYSSHKPLVGASGWAGAGGWQGVGAVAPGVSAS